MGRGVGKIVGAVYEIVRDAAGAKGIYTYEVRYYSKAYKLVLGNEFDFYSEDVLWKELLIYLMNSQDEFAWVDYLRGLTPLEFDPALIPEYLQCFQSYVKSIEVSEEIESLYEDLDDRKGRLRSLDVIGDPNVKMD